MAEEASKPRVLITGGELSITRPASGEILQRCIRCRLFACIHVHKICTTATTLLLLEPSE